MLSIGRLTGTLTETPTDDFWFYLVGETDPNEIPYLMPFTLNVVDPDDNGSSNPPTKPNVYTSKLYFRYPTVENSFK